MILVTGASGNIGRELVRRLSDRKLVFRAGYRAPSKAADLPGLEPVPFDLARPDTVRAALSGVDRAFLLSPDGEQKIALESAFAEEAKRQGVRHIVKLSSWRGTGEAHAFARANHAVEKVIQALGLPYTFLRPNYFMQNAITFFAASIKAHGTFSFPSNGARACQIDVRDIAEVAMRTLTEAGHEGQVYEMSGPESLSFEEVAQKISAATGKTVKYVDVSIEELRRSTREAGASEWHVEALGDFARFLQAGGSAALTDTVQRLTGKLPIRHDQFARDHADAFRTAER